MPDYRYIYLLFRPLRWQWKIGIAKCAIKRESAIDKDVPGVVWIVACGEVFGARRFEKKLHQYFAPSRIKKLKNVGKASGSTEWFNLTLLEAMHVWFWIWWASKGRWLALAVLIVFSILLWSKYSV